MAAASSSLLLQLLLLLVVVVATTAARVGTDCRARCAQCGDDTRPGDALRATICTLECRSGLTVAQYWRACQLYLGHDVGPAWVQSRSAPAVADPDPPGDESGPGPASPQQLDKKYGGFFRRVRSLFPRTPLAPRTPLTAPQAGSSTPSLASVLDEIRNYLQTLDGSTALQQQQQQQLNGIVLPSGAVDKRYGGFGRGRFRTKRGPDGRDDGGDLRSERERAEEAEEEEEEEEEEEDEEEEREGNGDESAAEAADDDEEEEDDEDGGQGEVGEVAGERTEGRADGKTVQKRYGGFMRRVGRPHKASWANQKRYGGFMRRFFGVSIRSEDSEGPADKRFSAYARRRLVQQ